MKKYTQREIKRLATSGAARDITAYNFKQMRDFLATHSLEKIGISCGIYGINAGLLKDTETGEIYAITARNSALFMAF